MKDPYFMHGHNNVQINCFAELLFFSFDTNVAYETRFEIEHLISMNSWMMGFALGQTIGQSEK